MRPIQSVLDHIGSRCLAIPSRRRRESLAGARGTRYVRELSPRGTVVGCTRTELLWRNPLETQDIPDLYKDLDRAGNRLPRRLYHVNFYHTSLQRLFPARYDRDLCERTRVPGVDDVGSFGTSVDLLTLERNRIDVPVICDVGNDGSCQGRKL